MELIEFIIAIIAIILYNGILFILILCIWMGLAVCIGYPVLLIVQTMSSGFMKLFKHKRILKENDKKVDVEKTYYRTGALECETPYVNDKKQGVEKYYSESGALELETPYVNGERHGVEKGYYESVALKWETPYVNGKIHGVEKYYSESGALKKETPYVNGKKQGVIEESPIL